MKSQKRSRIIGIYGYSGSGKTTSILDVLADLKSHNISCAVIKQSGHHVDVDIPGKDTYQFQAAGADPVVLAPPNGTAVFLSRKVDLDDLIDWLAVYRKTDIIIIESANSPTIEKIRFGEIDLRENTIWTYDGDFEKLITLILKEA